MRALALVVAGVRPSVGGNQMISLFARTRAYVDVSLSGVGKRLSWTRIGASASEGREEGVEKKGKRGRERRRHHGRNADDGRGRGRAERASKNVVDPRANRYDYRLLRGCLSVCPWFVHATQCTTKSLMSTSDCHFSSQFIFYPSY